VVVDRDGEDTLGVVLADHILVKARTDGLGIRDEATLGPLLRGGLVVFLQDLAAEGDALVTDIDPRSRDQLSDL
jgi:hypothetical protein